VVSYSTPTKMMRTVLFLVLSIVPGIFCTDECWKYSGIATASNWLNENDDILFHLTFRKANENLIIMNSQENGVWGEEIEKPLPFKGEVIVFVSQTTIGFTVKIVDKSSSNMLEYKFADRIPNQTIVSVTGAAEGNEALSCDYTPCYKYSGIATNITPSNWLNMNNDILFHLTFKKADDNKIIMNSQESGVWGDEIEKPLPFKGEVIVFVSQTTIGFTVKIVDKSSSNMQEYKFADRIPNQTIVSVTGAAEGSETLSCDYTPPPNPYPCLPAQPFYDDFSDTTLDDTKWLVAHKTWGEPKDGTYTNGGVVLQNVKVENGAVVFNAHGSLYDGPIVGINKDGSPKDDGKRTGGAIATRDYFGAGKYEVRMKAAPTFGVCSAIWTFFYKDGDPTINHEIDIEIPGRPAGAFENIDFDQALLNTWWGETDDLYTAGYTKLPSRMDDNEFHTWRFDWHTDANDRRVDFYLDGKFLRRMTQHVPFYAGRIWLGAWFPNAWAGDANFDQSRMEVDWVKFTPFPDEAFQCPEETVPNRGWAPLCKNKKQTLFQMRIQNDSKSTVRYLVQTQNKNGKWKKKLMKGGVKANKSKTDNRCLNLKNKCYRFKIIDKGENDGICCEHGDGWYDLKTDSGVLLRYSKFENAKTEKMFFGEGCPN